LQALAWEQKNNATGVLAMKKKWCLSLAAIIAIAFVLNACGGGNAGQGEAADQSEATGPSEDELIQAALAGGDAEPASSFGYIRNENGNGVIITYVLPMTANVVIPDALDGLPVVGFNTDVFRGNDVLVSITIPGSVTQIPENAFSGCGNLATVILNQGVTTIGNGAFYNCDNLVRVTLPEGLTSIGNSAFYDCDRLPAITIPSGVTTIGNQAFQSCDNLIKITLPDSLTSVGINAFTSCRNLSDLNVPARLTSFGRGGDGAFARCHKLPLATRDKLVSQGYDGRGF
jgi:hypothetical protein